MADTEVPEGNELEGLAKYLWTSGEPIHVPTEDEEDDPDRLFTWEKADIKGES